MEEALIVKKYKYAQATRPDGYKTTWVIPSDGISSRDEKRTAEAMVDLAGKCGEALVSLIQQWEMQKGRRPTPAVEVIEIVVPPKCEKIALQTLKKKLSGDWKKAKMGYMAGRRKE